jgi:hypothetical protein
MESEAQADRSSKPKYSGQCFCSGVKFEVADAEPLLQVSSPQWCCAPMVCKNAVCNKLENGIHRDGSQFTVAVRL